MAQYHELSDNQRRLFVDTVQLYEALADAQGRAQKFRGGLTWKTVNGAAYLVKTLGGRGATKSLGPRSEETERVYDAFVSGKAATVEKVASLKARLDEQARFNRAARLGRLPNMAARIAAALDDVGLLGRNIIIAGTNALFAYEAAAGVQFDRDITATGDIDLLWDVRSRIALLVPETEESKLIGMLRKIDKSFAQIRPYRAANNDGYMVDLIKRLPKPAHRVEARSIADPDDLEAAEIDGLDWLINASKLEQVVIAENGAPVRLIVPDPCAFALHKLWLSERRDRDPVKKRRDRSQANAVGDLVRTYLSEWTFDSERLRAVPEILCSRAVEVGLVREAPKP